MKFDFLDLNHQQNLIGDVKVFKLKVNKDPRGILVETLKSNWPEVFGKELPFAQTYYSITNPGVARDEDSWHYHPHGQIDRFVMIKGNAIFALYDWRKNSKTYGFLNLFKMGEANGDENQFLLLVPINVLHAFCNVYEEPCCLINYPTQLYDPKEEGRLPYSEINISPENKPFSWQEVRDYFKK